MDEKTGVHSDATRKGLPEGVVRLGWISFFTDISSEMAYLVLPLFLTAALGAPVAVLGLIEGLAECLVSLAKGLSGALSDRMGRRTPFVRLGYGLSAAAPFWLGGVLALVVLLVALGAGLWRGTGPAGA